MREIKFRAWDSKCGEWFGESNEQSLNFVGFHLFGECTMLCPPSVAYLEHLIIEQFTGLLDKNEVEIYEGDILSWYNWPAESQARCCAVVEMQCGAWGSRSLHPENEHPNDQSWQPFIGEDDVADLAGGSPENEIGSQTTLVVIGNIHENPELIK